MTEKNSVLDDIEGYLEYLGLSGVKHVSRFSGVIRPDSKAAADETVPTPALTLDTMRERLGDCQRCGLGKTRTELVFGAGNPDAQLVFVGEAPGRDEDIKGEPFVGRAGQLLTKIIEAIGLKREDVYICNVVKCRPPENRNPLPEEIEACEPFLLKQLEEIRPKVICALGKFAAQTLLKTDTPISSLRGKLTDYHGIPLVPTYHPAYLLRNPKMKREVWSDVKLLHRLLKEKRP